MALGDRYILYVNDVNDGYRYRARIQQEGAASAIELRPVDARNGAAELFGGEQGTQDPAAPLVRSSMSFRVLKTQGALVPVFGEAMDAFPVIWERQLLSANPNTDPYTTIWRGFLHTRYYEDAPDAFVDEVVLKAHDGIELLKTREYEGVTNSDSVWTTLTGILGGLGFGFGYETIMRWYPHLSSRRTSRIIEYLYTQDDRWEDEDEPDLRLSQYDVLVELLGRFQLQLVQSEGKFHIRQRYNLVGDQDVVEVYNSSGVYTGTGTVDTVNVDPIVELQGRPRSFLSKIQQAQSTHEHGKIDNLLHNGSFEAAIGSEWTQHALPAGLSANTRRILYDDITGGWDELPDSQAENSYAYRISLTGAASIGSYDVITQQGAGTISGLGGNRLDVRFMSSLTNVTQTFKPEWRVKVGGFYLQAKVARIQASSLKGEGATLVVDAIESGGSGVVIPAGQTLWIVERTDPNVDLVPWITTFTPEEDIEAGQVVIKGTLEENIDASDDIGLLYFTWTTTQTTIRYPYFPAPLCTYVQSGTDVPRWDECRVIVPLRASTGAVVSGIPEITFGAYVGAVVDFANLHYVVDEVSLLPVDASNRPLDRAITASSAGAVHDDTEILSNAFLTGDGPTKRSRARLSVLDGSGARQEITGGWKNGPYGAGEASTQLSIDALHTRLSIRQRKKHLAVRRITFLLHEGESIWPHHVITRGGVNYTIGRYERRFGTGQVYTELIELFQGSDSGIEDAVVQEGPASAGSGGRTLLAVSSGGGGATDWASITGKPPLVNTFNTRSGDITLTSADVTGALGFTPISLDAADARYVNVTGDTMTGDLVMASGTLKVNTDHIILDADGAAPGYVKLSNGRIGQQIGSGGTFQPFARTNVAETISANWTYSGTVGFGSATRQMLNLYSTQYAIGVQPFTWYARSASRFSFHVGGSHSDAENDPGSGGSTPLTFDADHAIFDVDLLPLSGYTGQIGYIDRKWLALHAAELWVETLVASERRVTTGGRLTVGFGTILHEGLSPVAANTAGQTIKVRHNNASIGDILHLEGAGRVEFMRVTAGPFGPFSDSVGDYYTYTVTRAIDGTGGNTWEAGSGVFNTGNVGDGFIDLTAQYSFTDTTHTGNIAGPTLNVWERSGTTYSDIGLRLALGRLDQISDSVAGQVVRGWGLYSDNAFLKGIIAVTRGYVGDNGEVLLGSSFAGGDFTAGRIMVGRTVGGTALVSLRGPNPGGDAVQLYGSATGRGLLMQYGGVEYLHLGWKWNGDSWEMSNVIGPWSFTADHFSGNNIWIGKNLSAEITANSGLFVGASDAGTQTVQLRKDADNFVQMYRSPDGVGFGIQARVGGVDKLIITNNTAVFSGSLTAATITGTVSVSGGEIVAGGGNVTLDDAGILLTTGTNTWNRVRWTDGSYIAVDQNVVGTGNGYSLNMNSNFANVIGTYGVFIAASNGVVTVDDVLALSARFTHPPLPANTAVPNIFLYNFNGRELWMATWAGRVKLHDI